MATYTDRLVKEPDRLEIVRDDWDHRVDVTGNGISFPKTNVAGVTGEVRSYLNHYEFLSLNIYYSTNVSAPIPMTLTIIRIGSLVSLEGTASTTFLGQNSNASVALGDAQKNIYNLPNRFLPQYNFSMPCFVTNGGASAMGACTVSALGVISFVPFGSPGFTSAQNALINTWKVCYTTAN